MDRPSNPDAIQRHEAGMAERVQQRPSMAPCVDIYENDSEVLVVADLPGVSRSNLSINLDQERLTISGTRHEAIKGTVLSAEFRDVDYHRAFLVPAGIDATKINAELKQGVLTLHLPKSEAIRPRQIMIKAG